MPLLRGLKMISQDPDNNVPHILGFQIARAAANDTLFELWNGPTNTARKMLVDLNGKFYSAAWTAGDILRAVTGGISGVRRLDSLALGTAYQGLRVNSGATDIEWAGASQRLTTDTTGASTSGTGEDDLISYTLPANVLASNGQALRIIVWGTSTGTAGTKTVKVYFGTTSVTLVAIPVPGGGYTGEWFAEAVVTRTGAATQLMTGQGIWNETASSFQARTAIASPGATLSGTVTIKATGECSNGADALTQTGLIVELVG